jgi:centrosomal protein CEP104
LYLAKDYEMMRRIKNDIKEVYYIGNEILNMERQLQIAKSKDDYDTCIKLRKKLEEVKSKRDNYDTIYETSRYERMIIMKRPSTAELLRDEEDRLRQERERLERERLEKERLEREKRRREEDEELNKQFNKKKAQLIDNLPVGVKKFVEYVPQKNKKKEEEFSDELQYNQGDRDLEPYFASLARSAGGNIPPPDLAKLRKALRQGFLTVSGVRLYSALICENWKLREAAVKGFLDFIENPLIPRYQGKTLSLFQTCIEVSKFACEDKVVQIYLEGLKILATCLAPPVCGNDIDPMVIQKSVSYFIPKFIKKICELNYRARDLTMNTLINIFKHPALNIGDLVKGCMDVVERQDGITPDKQPWNILLARLEIMLHTIEDYGIDESLWDWYPVFTELIIPSLFHQNPDCRMVAVEIVIWLYKIVGDDVKIIINDLNNLKPNLKEQLNSRFHEVDVAFKKDIEAQGQSLEGIKKSKDNLNSKNGDTINNLNLSQENKPNDQVQDNNKLFVGRKNKNIKNSSLESIKEANLDKEN